VLVAAGPTDAARVLPGIHDRPRVDDVPATVRHLIAAVAEHRAGSGFAAWRAIVACCADGQPEVPTLLWIARVVHHELGGNPVDTVARWIHDTLEREARVDAHAASEARRIGRERLADDPDRIRAHPEARLRTWQRTARPLAELIDVPIAQLGRELARSVLVDPHQPSDAARPLVDRLLAATPVAPEARLAVADAINALACIGVELPDVRARLAYWLPGLTAVEPPLPGRIRGALAALAHHDVARARYVAPEPRADAVAGRVFPSDTLAVVGQLIAAVTTRAPLFTIDELLHRVGEEIDELCERGLVDEPTVLWLARVAFHTIDRGPLGEVATHAHDWLWQIPDELDAIRCDAATRPRRFPLARTVADGAYRVEQWLVGTGSQQLHRGADVATGAHVLVAVDDHAVRRQSIDELRAAVAYRIPGLFELAHVGAFDADVDHWCIVERVPPGDWLPRALGPADPWTAPRKAIELGASAARIALRAATGGILLVELRPELMWMATIDGRHIVTGLSTRATELFARHRGDASTRPIFDRDYRAPEAADTPDDRSVVFSLAAMIAEWATGRSDPAAIANLTELGHGVPLRAVLEPALSPDRDARPRLAELVDELDRLLATAS
jgi:hypothetical protein